MALLALGGCGGEEEGTPAVASGTAAGEGGSLVWALSASPGDVDPLRARTYPEQLLARQIHEPLVAELHSPFEQGRRSPGLALAARPSADRTIWRLALRGGVRFQDGTPFDASAVLANSDRWLASDAAAELLSGLLTADAPRPDLVRFILAAPDPAFDRRLASPRLGIVSPRALAAGGERRLNTGTGPFELRERGPGRVLLARNTDWWGTPRELGPALDQVELRVVAEPGERLEALSTGEARAADALGPAELRALRREPLLEALPQGDGRWLGLERSVRGIDSGREVPSLAGAWLTDLAAAG